MSEELKFNPIYYLLCNPDVAKEGLDPFVHYEQYGQKENRKALVPEEQDTFYYEFIERRNFFRKAFTALSFNAVGGDYIEFGTGMAVSFSMAYLASKKANYNCHLWACDSFQGLPESELKEDIAHSKWKEGNYSVSKQEFIKNCSYVGLKEEDYTLVEGYFNHSLKDHSKLPRDVSLAYVDCDMKSSTDDVFKYLQTVLKTGSILAFDDYFCFTSDYMSGEYLSFEEFKKNNSDFNFIPFIQFGWHGQSFVVEKK